MLSQCLFEINIKSDQRNSTYMAIKESLEKTQVEAIDTVVLSANKLNVYYGDFHAVMDIDMNIKKNRITALIGPSGCGKSTLLRSINRMNDLVDGLKITGRIKLHGDDIYHYASDVIALRKRMGMVFQKPNPFPMSIFENVIYP